MNKIKLLDSKYEFENNDTILAQAEGIKFAKKFGIDNFSNIEYHQEFGYLNFTMEYKNFSLTFQALIKEKELYFKLPNTEKWYEDISKNVMNLLYYIFNQNEKCHKFYTAESLKSFIFLIDKFARD